jgi:predicted ABC-type ATPase
MAKARRSAARQPRCIVIAGPNGAGKTTLARELLLGEIRTENFVNADYIAHGLSPFRPERAAVAAGRLMLEEMDRLVAARVDFAFETTLSGVVHAARLRRIKDSGFRIEILFIRLESARLAVARVGYRVRQGGHNVPKADILRRFERGWNNFNSIYRALADSWVVIDNSGKQPRLLESGP